MTMRNTILAALHAEEKDHEILNGIFTMWRQLKTMGCLAEPMVVHKTSEMVSSNTTLNTPLGGPVVGLLHVWSPQQKFICRDRTLVFV